MTTAADELEARTIAEGLTSQQRETLQMTRSWDGAPRMSPTVDSLVRLGLLAIVVGVHPSGLGAAWTPLGNRVVGILQEPSRAQSKKDRPNGR